MVSPTYHTNFVVQTIVTFLKRDIKILSVDSNSTVMKTPQTKFEPPVP